jgi:nickel-type superoxide dismutase maturation protease
MPRLLRLVIGSPKAHYRLPVGALTAASLTLGLALPVALLWRRRATTVEVAGDSMRPTLDPGDRLVVIRIGRRPVRPGDLVTVPDPRRPERVMVKRVAAVTGGSVVVEGDNPAASTDSRTFGPVPTSTLGGRVVYRYWPEGRRGRPQRERYAARDVD